MLACGSIEMMLHDGLIVQFTVIRGMTMWIELCMCLSVCLADSLNVASTKVENMLKVICRLRTIMQIVPAAG